MKRSWRASTGAYKTDVLDEQGYIVAKGCPASTVVGQERAELIALAVSCHEELLDVLKWLSRGEHEWAAPPQAIDFIERAIALAENVK